MSYVYLESSTPHRKALLSVHFRITWLYMRPTRLRGGGSMLHLRAWSRRREPRCSTCYYYLGRHKSKQTTFKKYTMAVQNPPTTTRLVFFDTDQLGMSHQRHL